MTIGDMRRLMLKKIVPESVVPQNIVNFLMDENAQLPEPDAFTFLTRLRGLGIGSADFLYLLEGCGAPEAAVEKIRANPAMNLQGLILTLEGAGMTSKDYTRILYTARQIWERTLTLRLETSERLVEESGTDVDDEEQGVEAESVAAEAVNASETASIASETPNAAAADIAADNEAYSDVNTVEDRSAETDVNDAYEAVEAPLPHGKPPVAYPDATEELMSVDFGSDYEFEDNGADSPGSSESASDRGAAKDQGDTSGTIGIGSGGAVDLFGGSDGGYSGELGYSQSFTESFVNDYMTDFAEDDLTDLSDDDDFADDFGGTYYGDFEQYTDEIPAVGNGVSGDVREQVREHPSNGIPDAREPFEVHIASYDIPEDPDEFNRAAEGAVSERHTEPVNDVRSEQSTESAGRLMGEVSESGSPSTDKGDGHAADGFEFVTEAELPKKSSVPFEVKIDYGDEPQAAADSPVSKAAPQAPAGENSQQYNGETTMIVPISREMIEQNISAMAAETADPETAPESEAARAEDDNAKTAVQRSLPKTARQKPRFEDDDDETSDISENFGRNNISGNNYEPDDGMDPSRFKKGAVIAAGVGAAVLIGANVIVAQFIGKQDENKIAYAESAEDIFAEIYYANEAGIKGADTVSEYQTDYSKVFGDLLICGNGLGTFTSGSSVYSVSENKITASAFQGGALTALGTFEPEDGTKFVAAFETGDSLIAVYSGNDAANNGGDCGYLRIKDGQTLYTVRQSGRLTDLEVKDGEIRIGSVYTPSFRLQPGETRFGAEDTGVYLPKIGTDEKTIEPQNVILSKTQGYSYALSAGYVLEGGTVISAKAAIGNPVYASADGRFIMNGSETKKDVTEEYGLMISANGEDIAYERCGKVGCAAAFGNGIAALENGKPILRDGEFKYCSELGTTSRIPTKMRFSDNMLVLSDNDGIFLTADCSELSAVRLRNLKQINGDCVGNSAITLEADTNGIKLTRYVLENGKEKEIVSFTRELTSDQIKTLVCGTANAMVAADERCGAAYSYFDGVSVISEYVTLSDASEAATLFDDKTGFEYAFMMDGKIYAVCSKGAVDVAVKESDDSDDQGSGDEPRAD
ncbi:MAG: hypothetical protein K2N56_12725 [Oscillospiraceae bacterium]|nr:hypothetical protein [Oscillospiraceae bacterium]